MRYCFNYLVQDFCPLKIEISQFPDGFPLKNNGKLKRVWRSLRGSNNKPWDVGWGNVGVLGDCDRSRREAAVEEKWSH